MPKKQQSPIEMWQKCKAEYGGSIILVRVGDFFETYEQDASMCELILGVRLAWRQEGIKPKYRVVLFVHTEIDAKLSKLIQAGQRVGIVEWKPENKPQKV